MEKRGKSILVVDDEQDLLHTLEDLLKGEGYDVSTADSGHEALVAVNENHYDMVILDIRMPDVDGIKVLEKIKKKKKDKSAVIMITAYASEEAPIQALKLGADDYIMKPFETDDFLHSVQKNMEIAKLRQERKQHMKKLEEKNQELEDAQQKYRGLVTSLSSILFNKTGDHELKQEIEELIENCKKDLEQE